MRPHQNVVNHKKRAELPGGIDPYFKSAKRVQKTSMKAVVFFKLVTLLLVTARLPFRLVLHPVFKALVWFLDPTVPFPTRADIVDKVLSGMVESGVSDLKAMLLRTAGMAVTFDLWMSKKTDDILSLSVHFISEEWVWQHKHLGLVAMNGQTTGVIIVAKLRELLQQFSLKGKLFASVLDGGAKLTYRDDRARPSFSR